VSSAWRLSKSALAHTDKNGDPDQSFYEEEEKAGDAQALEPGFDFRSAVGYIQNV
jgi:hypothetical protein